MGRSITQAKWGAADGLYVEDGNGYAQIDVSGCACQLIMSKNEVVNGVTLFRLVRG